MGKLGFIQEEIKRERRMSILVSDTLQATSSNTILREDFSNASNLFLTYQDLRLGKLSGLWSKWGIIDFKK